MKKNELNFELNEDELDFIDSINNSNKKKNISKGLNPENHNIENKRYEKLSLSLTKQEKLKIKEFKDKNFPRTSISTMIMMILEEKGVFL